MQGGVIEAPTGHEHSPPVSLRLDERKRPSHERFEYISPRAGPMQPVAHPRIEPADDTDLHGVDQPPTITEIGVNQGARDASLLGHLLEGDQQRIVLSEEPFGSVDDQATPHFWVEARRPGASPWPLTGIGRCQAEAPVSSTAVIASPGASG